jgi:hypothetical protein
MATVHGALVLVLRGIDTCLSQTSDAAGRPGTGYGRAIDHLIPQWLVLSYTSGRVTLVAGDFIRDGRADEPRIAHSAQEMRAQIATRWIGPITLRDTVCRQSSVGREEIGGGAIR